MTTDDPHPSRQADCLRRFGPPWAPLIAAIRDAAERQGLTLSDVAQRAGLGDLLVRLEAGDANEDEVFLDHLLAITRVLGVSTGELAIRTEALAREERKQ